MKLPPLFGRRSSDARDTSPGFFDVGGTVYAVGDIHGKIELLEPLVDRIRKDIARGDRSTRKTLAFMGDYVDRGRASRQVLEYLMALKIDGCELVFILGNHDREMISFADDPIKHSRWLRWGGIETLQSFGISSLLPNAGDDELLDVGHAFSKALGPIRAFVEDRMIIWTEIGNLILSHAGMDPDFDIEEQREGAMLWGSRDFLRRGGPPGRWYVHGHYVHPNAAIIGNRIAVDSGAYESGVLSVARITDDGCAFLQQT